MCRDGLAYATIPRLGCSAARGRSPRGGSSLPENKENDLRISNLKLIFYFYPILFYSIFDPKDMIYIFTNIESITMESRPNMLSRRGLAVAYKFFKIRN